MSQTPLFYSKNHLFLEDLNLSKITQRVGTPSYIYSKRRILANLRRFRSSFSPEASIHFAMKANSNEKILKLFRSQHIGVDTVSGGEIRRALNCGFKPDQIIFAGVGKSEEEIYFALTKKIKLFNVESTEELERIGKLAKKQRTFAAICLRLNPNINAKTHPYITTALRESKFGMDFETIPSLERILKKFRPHLVLRAIGFHLGSQIQTIQVYRDALTKITPILLRLRNKGFPLTHVDLGGGMGISYEGKKGIDLSSLGKVVSNFERDNEVDMILEPGRVLTADAGVLISKVEYVKKTRHRNFIILNTGMHHMIRPCLYGAKHRILPLMKSTARKQVFDIVGPICESSDFLAKQILFPEPKPGDAVAICDVGAYGFVMASDYNLHPKPVEVLA